MKGSGGTNEEVEVGRQRWGVGWGGSVLMYGVEVYTLGTAVSSWLASRSVFKPTPRTGIQAASHAKKCECGGRGGRVEEEEGGYLRGHCKARKFFKQT